MLKIANIISDEKFIDGVIECQDLTSLMAEHEYIIVSDSIVDFKYIKKYRNKVTHILPKQFLGYLIENEFDAVFLHSFCVLFPSLIVQIPLGIKVFWFSWGYDIYTYPKSHPFVQLNLYGKETRKILPKTGFHIKSAIKNLLGLKALKSNLEYKALNRIDFYSGVLEYEYDLLKSISVFKAKPVSYQYSNLSILDQKVDNKIFTGNNILIGNSGDCSNNHIDVIKYLQSVNLNNRKIYMPLAYSGMPEYIFKVKCLYEQKFKIKFVPLETFVPYDEYLNIMSSCSVAIFAHERQQAIGNINMALQNGCKVFISETNLVYDFYKKLGITLFSLQTDFSQKELDTPLEEDQILNNKRIIRDRYCKDTYLRNLINCYENI